MTDNKKPFLSKSGISEVGLISARHVLITISKLQILSYLILTINILNVKTYDLKHPIGTTYTPSVRL